MSMKQSLETSVRTGRQMGSTFVNAAGEKIDRDTSFSSDNRAVMGQVQMIGGALVAIIIIALVLTEVYDAIEVEETSPWYSIVESAETTGVAAISLLVVGLLVLAASTIMRFMGGSGFGR